MSADKDTYAMIAAKVQAEAVDVRLGASSELLELGMAADTDPHALYW